VYTNCTTDRKSKHLQSNTTLKKTLLWQSAAMGLLDTMGGGLEEQVAFGKFLTRPIIPNYPRKE
jgi:hypothetical protein